MFQAFSFLFLPFFCSTILKNINFQCFQLENPFYDLKFSKQELVNLAAAVSKIEKYCQIFFFFMVDDVQLTVFVEKILPPSLSPHKSHFASIPHHDLYHNFRFFFPPQDHIAILILRGRTEKDVVFNPSPCQLVAFSINFSSDFENLYTELIILHYLVPTLLTIII